MFKTDFGADRFGLYDIADLMVQLLSSRIKTVTTEIISA
jgi:hypothetical protein